ncbi:MAG: pentapeptide repeat-containing protein [Ktedonobacterales bacterium]
MRLTVPQRLPVETPPAPDTTEPTPARIAELQAAYSDNITHGKAPYAHVAIRTAGELRWILAERGWSGERDAMGKPRPQLEEADLHGANLAGMPLCQAILRNATVEGACLFGTSLYRAELQGTRCEKTDLRHVDLFGADLDHAWLWDADFRGASLARTSLCATHFRGADLRGADLTGAWMDSTTRFRAVKLDSGTRIGQVVWNSVPLIQVDWTQMPTTGEEADIPSNRPRVERMRAVLAAQQAYDGLAVVLQSQGVKDWASRYHLRALRLERRAQLLRGHPLSWFVSWLIDMLSGYGQYTARALRAYALVIAVFATSYYALTNSLSGSVHTRSIRLSWIEALVLSVSSFHGRGFFPQAISLGDPIAVVAALEAVIGLFIELVFITTFSRRVLDR